MSTNFTPRGIRIAIAVVAIATAAVAFRSSVFALLIEPIGWLLWAGYRLVASVDQGICWAVVVSIGAVWVIRLIPARMGVPEQTPAHESRWGSAGRLAYWEGLASQAESQEGRTAIQASLAALAADVADGTKQPPPQRSQASGNGWWPALFDRLLAGRRRQADLRAIEEQLAWMESALEIRHEHSGG